MKPKHYKFKKAFIWGNRVGCYNNRMMNICTVLITGGALLTLSGCTIMSHFVKKGTALDFDDAEEMVAAILA